MNYLLFNNDIYASDGVNVDRIEKRPHLSHLFAQFKEAHVCVVDIDVLIAPAPESALDKKDGMLARKFAESYQGEYILQDERIGNNIFQVIGIKCEKVKEVYSLIPSERVAVFVPYAVTLRNFLAYQKILANRPVVFLDDLGHEKLITVFEGLKFSRTRTVLNNKAEHLLAEIKRSAINFEKKLADQKDKNVDTYSVVTNNMTLGHGIREIEKDLNVEILGGIYPAFEGLKRGGFNLKYILPEEIIKKRRQQEFKKRARSVSISALIIAVGMLFYFYNSLNVQLAHNSFEQKQARQRQLEQNLKKLDPYVYRHVLQQQKRVNYGLKFLSISQSLPISYKTYSFGFYDKGGHWIIEEYLYTPDDEIDDNIPAAGALKSARIKDFLVNNRPGKYLRIE